MSAKSFLDGASDVVVRSLRGVVRLSPGLALDSTDKIVFRRCLQESSAAKVILLSGGGAGHEPAHAGYVGEGMLDVAVSGNIFASPSASQVLKALRTFISPLGTLVITKNYTGDVLSFGLAVEKAKAAGLNCRLLVVGDDVSISREKCSKVGRRGLAGTALVHKIAGAAAAEGANLEQVYSIAASAAKNMATIGVSLGRCHVPGRNPDSVEDAIGPEEIEYGMGIHNEPGAQRAPLGDISVTVSQLLETLLNMEDVSRSFVNFQKDDNVVLLVNNLGGLSILEVQVIVDETLEQMSSKYGIRPKRLFKGTFVSSVNGPGFSLTILKLEEQMLPLLDRMTDAQGWVTAAKLDNTSDALTISLSPQEDQFVFSKMSIHSPTFKRVLEEICSGIAADEPKITYFDTIAGDGDCGETLLAGSTGIATALGKQQIETSDIISGLKAISKVVENTMGGTSGAIYVIYLNALVHSLDELARKSSASSSEASPVHLATAASQALSELYNYTRARIGHRTLMDVLIPFVQQLAETPHSLGDAVAAATLGFDDTKRMKASFGRASYVDETIFSSKGDLGGEDAGIPDAGAAGLLSILRSLQRAVNAP